MTRGQRIITKIEQMFNETREKYPHITDDMLDSQGAIYYMNGNDGTDFDWNANQRCCEFYIYHKNEIGFIKLYVEVGDTVTIYVYPNGEMSAVETIEKKLDKGDSLYLATLLYEKADRKYIYDSIITEIDFTYEPDEYELREMNEAYEEPDDEEFWDWEDEE